MIMSNVFMTHIVHDCSSADHRAAITSHYNQIVGALQSADNGTVPKIPFQQWFTIKWLAV